MSSCHFIIDSGIVKLKIDDKIAENQIKFKGNLKRCSLLDNLPLTVVPMKQREAVLLPKRGHRVRY